MKVIYSFSYGSFIWHSVVTYLVQLQHVPCLYSVTKVVFHNYESPVLQGMLLQFRMEWEREMRKTVAPPYTFAVVSF